MIFFRTPGVDEKKASVTVDTMKQSVYKEGSNLVLLQEEEENVAEDINDDADVNAESNTINDNKKYMVVKIKEDKNT